MIQFSKCRFNFQFNFHRAAPPRHGPVRVAVGALGDHLDRALDEGEDRLEHRDLASSVHSTSPHQKN